MKEVGNTTTHLREISLSFSRCESKDTELILQALVQNETLETLVLTSISHSQLQSICNILATKTTVSSLVITESALSPYWPCQFLSFVLQKNRFLISLSLSYCQILASGAYSLSAGLRNHPTIRVLELRCNKLGDYGVDSICTALEGNQSLRELDLSWNAISQVGFTRISTFLTRNAGLRRINLKQNYCRSRGALAMSQAFRNNAVLKRVDLSGNWIDEEGMRAILASLKESNVTLEKVVVCENPASSESIVKLLSFRLVQANLIVIRSAQWERIGRKSIFKLLPLELAQLVAAMLI